MALNKYALILILTYVITGRALTKPWYDLRDAEQLFKKFQYDYNRHYETEDDLERHYEWFVSNLVRINYLNSKQNTAVYGITLFADHPVIDAKLMLGYLSDFNSFGAYSMQTNNEIFSIYNIGIDEDMVCAQERFNYECGYIGKGRVVDFMVALLKEELVEVTTYNIFYRMTMRFGCRRIKQTFQDED